MNLKNFSNSLLLLCLFSCANIPSSFDQSLKHSFSKFNLQDKSGKFWLNREAGFKNGNESFVVKREIFPEGKVSGKPLEQSVSISKLASFGKNMKVLVPKASQFVVWFDKKRYFNQLKFSEDGKSLNLKLVSPESEWSKREKIDIPKNAKLLCFYSQIIECASITGFIQKALSLRSGVMNFHLIWDGYPYLQEQYPGVTQALFEKAKLKYDGLLKKGENRFSLEVSGQSISFVIDANGVLIKKFWVAQGLSMVKREVI